MVAKELARGGRDVVVLEQGGHYTKERLHPARRRDDAAALRGHGAARDRRPGDHRSCRDATSAARPCTTSATASARPSRSSSMWRARTACATCSGADLLPSFERVERMLKVKPIRHDEINTLNNKIRAGLREARLQRLRHQPQPRELHAVRLLPARLPVRRQAEHADHLRSGGRSQPGARIYANCPVRRIVAEAGRVRRVEGDVVDALGRAAASLHGRRAQVVVLCAGAINSPELLLQQRHRQRATAASAATCTCIRACCCRGVYDEDIYGYRGIPQSYYVDEFIDLERDPRQRLHPDAGLRLPGDDGDPAARASARAHFEIMQQLPSHGRHPRADARPVQRRGDASTAPARPQINYTLNAKERRCFAEGMQHCAEILFASGAQRVLAPYTQPVVARARATRSTSSPSAACARATSRSPRRIRRAPAGWARIRRARGRQLVLPVARAAEPLRLRHGRVPHLARRAAADLDRRDRRPHGALHRGELGDAAQGRRDQIAPKTKDKGQKAKASERALRRRLWERGLLHFRLLRFRLLSFRPVPQP